jgi:hypothetical protein
MAHCKFFCSFLFCRSLFILPPPPQNCCTSHQHPAPLIVCSEIQLTPTPTPALRRPRFYVPCIYAKIKLIFLRQNEQHPHKYELYVHIIPGWYTLREPTKTTSFFLNRCWAVQVHTFLQQKHYSDCIFETTRVCSVSYGKTPYS